MAKILFLSTAVPPHPESQTIRNVFFMRALAEAGHQLSVVTVEPASRDESLAALMPPASVDFTPPPLGLLRDAWVAKLPAGRRLAWVRGVFSNLFRIPDAYAGWDRVVLRRLRDQPPGQRPDAVVSSSGSYTAHLAGAELARRWGVPLVAELGDPWSRNPIWPATLWWRVLGNGVLERRCIPGAAALVVTTEATAEDYRRWLGPTCPAVHVVTMGFQPEEFASATVAPLDGPLVITYVGTSYRLGRNLTPLLEATAAVASARPLQVAVVGPSSDAYGRFAARRGLAGVRFFGRVPYAESLLHIQRAGILVIVGNTGGLQIPGKAFMYLASGRPILLVGQMDAATDPTWELLRRFGGTVHAINEPEAIARTLSQMVAEYPALAAASWARRRDPALQEFEWPRIGARFARVVDRVLRP